MQDEDGRQVVLISTNRTLQVSTTDAGPHLTPQMAQDLAEELHQWATCQQTVRSGNPRSPRSSRESAEKDSQGSAGTGAP